MNKVTKKSLYMGWDSHDTEIIKIKKEIRDIRAAVLRLEKLTDEKLLDTSEPKLKQLDQSVFKQWPDCWKFFAIDKDGGGWRYREEPKIDKGDNRWSSSNTVPLRVGGDYDASNWQNSLIERDKAELTGSDLCRAMLERGDKFVMCGVSEDGQEDTMLDGYYAAVESVSNHGRFYGYPHEWLYVTPINNQGEPLTAADVGL